MVNCACLPSRRDEKAAVTKDRRHGPFHAVACSRGLAIASCCWHEQSRLGHRLVACRTAGPVAAIEAGRAT